MTTNSGTRLAARRAIEALRNGVPNMDSVRILGCSQPQAEEQFKQLLAGESHVRGLHEDLKGMLVSGAFGAGKSHLLTHFQARALDQGYVCSKLAISKETPLFNLDSVFKAAVSNAQVPGHKGRLVEDLALGEKTDSQAYGAFYGWATNETRLERLNGIFPATLIAYERLDDPDMKNRIEAFWSGGRLNVSDLKRALRQLGAGSACAFRNPRLADLPPQRLRFMVEMIKGAGYNGWVVLLDELELVGYYSILQRGRAYAELARWLSNDRDADYPGLIPVGTVTDDFASVILSPEGQKKDLDNIRPKLIVRPRLAPLEPLAQTGMRVLLEGCTQLKTPGQQELELALENLRELYSQAYEWDAPALKKVKVGGVGIARRMRYKVRAAINSWDLQRLGLTSRPETESDDFAYSYEENADLETRTEDDADFHSPHA